MLTGLHGRTLSVQRPGVVGASTVRGGKEKERGDCVLHGGHHLLAFHRCLRHLLLRVRKEKQKREIRATHVMKVCLVFHATSYWKQRADVLLQWMSWLLLEVFIKLGWHGPCNVSRGSGSSYTWNEWQRASPGSRDRSIRELNSPPALHFHQHCL